jgi:hypothetical protein
MFQIFPQVSQRQYVEASVFSAVAAIIDERQDGQAAGFGRATSGVIDLM